jgi:hypothetical protein
VRSRLEQVAQDRHAQRHDGRPADALHRAQRQEHLERFAHEGARRPRPGEQEERRHQHRLAPDAVGQRTEDRR